MSKGFTKEFLYDFNYHLSKYRLKSQITVPLGQSCSELSYRITTAHNIPCYLQPELRERLEDFCEKQLILSQDEVADQNLKNLLADSLDEAKLINGWNLLYTDEVLQHAKHESLSGDVLFSEVFHSLIHSECLEALLQLEHKYALVVEELLDRRDRSFDMLNTRQRIEMEEAVKQLGIGYTDDQINRLAQQHFDNVQLTESQWDGELCDLQSRQRNEYRQWVTKLYEELQMGRQKIAIQQLYRSMNIDTSPIGGREITSENDARREESFTVHLGAQLKSSHNLRIISADILDLCRRRHLASGCSPVQCFQTTVSLYSNSLSGLVLLVDNRLNSYTGIKQEFARVCQQSTDFHMLTLGRQFELIEAAISESAAVRLEKRSAAAAAALMTSSSSQQLLIDESLERSSVKSSTSSNSIDELRAVRLQTGDCYVTRHANLSEVHLVFHLVTDDSVRTSVSELSSRHPTVLGYRSVLKCCFRYDIRTITFPLLLVHEMTEEMTVAWCMKRAELIFKCVKGFMMELAMWSGQEAFTIQFLLPKGLSDETFSALSNMMPSIFRMSNPVIAKTL